MDNLTISIIFFSFYLSLGIMVAINILVTKAIREKLDEVGVPKLIKILAFTTVVVFYPLFFIRWGKK